jgi:hypothetical protein
MRQGWIKIRQVAHKPQRVAISRQTASGSSTNHLRAALRYSVMKSARLYRGETPKTVPPQPEPGGSSVSLEGAFDSDD